MIQWLLSEICYNGYKARSRTAGTTGTNVFLPIHISYCLALALFVDGWWHRFDRFFDIYPFYPLYLLPGISLRMYLKRDPYQKG